MGHEELTAIVFWAALIGIGGALASVAFRELIHALEWAITGNSGGLVAAASGLDRIHRVIVPVLGGVAAGLVIQLGAAWVYAKRSVDYMEAVAVGDGMIAARPTLIRSISSLLTIASGGSIGREGPMVQLAALIGSKVGQLRKAPTPRRRLLVACGAAAGIASAYNAPIAGALFVAEIVMGSFAMESFGPLLVASVSADATIHRVLGYGPVFNVPAFHFGENWELILYAIFGVLLGHLAPPFLALLDWSKARFRSLPGPLYAKFAVGGLIVGLISIAFPQVWGNGYSVVDAIFHDRLTGWLLLAVLLAKVASTASTVGSGAVGGVFTPTLFIGAAIGALIGALLRLAMPHMQSSAGAFAAVGMGGFLAATTHAPLTSVLMIFEMTLDHQVVLPLILACVTAHYVAKVYRGGASIYRESLAPAAADGSSVAWQLRTVAELIKPAVAVVGEAMSVRQMLDTLPPRPVQAVYIVNADEELVASVEPREIFAKVERREIDADTPVLAVSTPDADHTDARPQLDGCSGAFPPRQRHHAAGGLRTLAGEAARRDLAPRSVARAAGPVVGQAFAVISQRLEHQVAGVVHLAAI